MADAPLSSAKPARHWLSRGLEGLIHSGKNEFDVVIIGSGYGGSIAAAQLAGLHANGTPISVCLLERGKEFTPGSFPSSAVEAPTEMRFALPGQSSVAGNLDGLYDFRLGGDLNVVLGSGLGGGSLINAGVMQRPTDAVFDANWPVSLQNGSALHPYFSRAEELLGAVRDGQVNTIKQHQQHQEAPVAKYLSMQKLAKYAEQEPATGAHDERFRAAPITVAMRDGAETSAGISLNACVLCGDCACGCNHGAKESLDVNLLAAAKNRGAEIYTGASVIQLHKQHDGAFRWTVDVVHTSKKLRERQGSVYKIKAKRVIVAAGSLGSTEILMRSRQRCSLEFSSQLGKRFSSNGDLLVAGFDQRLLSNSIAKELTPFDERRVGPTITAIIDDRDKRGRGGIVIEEMAVPAPLQRFFEELFTTSSTLHELSAADSSKHRHIDNDAFDDAYAVSRDRMQRTSLYAVMGDDGADGELQLALQKHAETHPEIPQEGLLKVRWPDLKNKGIFDQQVSRLEQLAKTSRIGGRILPNPAWKPLPESMMFLANGQRGPLTTVHPLGGCAMADSSQLGVVDQYGRVYDGDAAAKPGALQDGLVVLDGAVIPTALGTNPALTIAAVSLRAVDNLIRLWGLSPAGSEADQAGIAARPWFRRLPKTPYSGYRQTQVEVVERLCGEVMLRNTHGHFEPAVMEITLTFEPKEVRQLCKLKGESNRVPCRLLVAAHHSPENPARSRIRIYTREAWERLEKQMYRPQKPNELRLEQRPLEERRDAAAEFIGELSGSLDLFGRGNSGIAGRVFRATLAWVPNRGLRDTWQHLFPREYEKQQLGKQDRQAGGGMFKRLLGLFRLASRAGEHRLLEYRLHVDRIDPGSKVDGRFDLTGSRVEGTKTFTYSRRCNPWKQLSQMTLTRCNGLEINSDCRPVLSLDTRFLSRINVPLLRVVQQHDRVNAMLDLASLGAYLMRMLIGIHMWSFRSPDTPLPGEPRRLPASISGVAAPEIREIQVGVIPEERIAGLCTGSPVKIRLTRYPRAHSSKNPVMMIHGYSASGASFTHDTIHNNLAKSLWENGRDVWILDMRTSPGLPTARYPWSFEDVAGADIPAAIDHICRYYADGRKVDVLAHCMGAVMFSMGALNPEYIIQSGAANLYFKEPLSADQKKSFFKNRVRSVIFSQVTPTMVFSPDNKLRAYLMQYLKELMPNDYQFRPEHAPTLGDQLLDRLLYSLPYPRREFDIENPPWPPWKRTPFTRTRHRMDALYGRDFNLDQVDENVLRHIDDFFGPLSIDTVAQTIHFARLNTIATKDGRNLFLTDKNRGNWCFPTCSFNGEDNGLSDIATAERTEQVFRYAFAASYIKIRNQGYGHQDSLIGKRACEDIFPRLIDFLDKQDSAPATVCEPPQLLRLPWDFEMPWYGPVVIPHDDGERIRILTGADPVFGSPSAMLFMPLKRELDSFTLMEAGKLGSLAINDACNHKNGCKSKGAYVVMQEQGLSISDIPASLLRSGDSSALLVLLYYGDRPSGEKLEVEIAASIERFLKMESNRDRAIITHQPADDYNRVENTLCIAFGSCQYPAGISDEALAYESWRLLGDRLDNPNSYAEPRPEMLVLMGDQVYVDATAGLFDPESVDDRYELPYRKLYTNSHVRNVLRQLPLYAMLDDHEIDDNWQPLKRESAKNRQRRDLGIEFYCRYQRGLLPNAAGGDDSRRETPPLWYAFKERGLPFFMMDTRTDRSMRNAETIDLPGTTLISEEQFAAFEKWLHQGDRQLPRFIVSPSMLFPRHLDASEDLPASALRSDGWDGYAQTLHRVVAAVAQSGCRNVVFLSGDEHLSCHATVEISIDSESSATIHSIHCSGLYAPLPFANTKEDDLIAAENYCFEHEHREYSCKIRTTFRSAGKGFALLHIARHNGRWHFSLPGFAPDDNW
jgi:cholesterol oxidase